MLTPNDVKLRLQANREFIKNESTVLSSPGATACALAVELYAEVLQEIAHGSIDPKSLAMAALDIEA